MEKVIRPLRGAAAVFLAFLFLATGVLSLKPSSAAEAGENRSFHFPAVIIEAEINPDGSMSIREERTFRFRGQFRGATSTIPLPENAAIRNVLVSEKGEPYREMPVGTIDIPGTFFVEYQPNEVLIDWSYDAFYEERTFTITYVVDNAVLVHDDVAELYWQFIGDQSDVRTDQARVTLSLPSGAEKEEIRAWAHGPLHGEVIIDSATSVKWVLEGLPERTFLEGRVTFPITLVPQADNFSGRQGLPAILAEEQRWARQANLRRTVARLDFILAPLLFLGMAIYFILFRIGIGRFPETYKGDYYRDLPGDYSPAEAGFLVRKGRTTPEDFTATVMDLARRGHLKLEEYRGESGLIRKRPFTDYRVIPTGGKDELNEHERHLQAFIFDQVGRRSPAGTTMRDIQDFGRKKRSETATFYKNWVESIKKEAEELKFFKGPAWSGIIVAIVISVLCIPFIFLGMYFSGAVAMIFGPLLIVGFALTKRFTPRGADHFAKWRAFKKFLQHFSRLDRSTIPSLAIWEHYLVYAVTLGVAKEVMDQLHLVYPELKSGSAAVIWPAYGVMAANPVRFNSFTSSLDQSFKTAFQSVSSSGSGGGGGFSGGGGGGGGGGGVSAR